MDGYETIGIIGKNGILTIPVKIRKDYGIDDKTPVRIIAKDGEITIKKLG